MSVRHTPPATPPASRREGRLFGGLVLGAFGLYGAASAVADTGVGVAFAAANSVAVSVVGVIGYRQIRRRHSWIGTGYLASRIVEAVLLAGGIALYAVSDVAGADNTGYLFGMIALGVGSVPFWYVVARENRVPNRLAKWGMIGYVFLASGATLELATDRSVTVVAAIPGGLFEVVVGIYLLVRGFNESTHPHTPTE